MQFTRIEVSGNKWLAMRGIKSISLTFTEFVQLLIGTNGSCKTTLLREISVLPVTSSDYEKHGFKTIELTHRNSNYKLLFTNATGPKYTFTKDDEKLNDAGTASVQRELCRQHFGIDDDIMDVMHDRVFFTQMAPMKRRDWIMRLSGIDFDFAMKLYNDTKSKARAMSDVVKHLDKRLNDELAKLPSKEEIETLRVECETYTDQLNFLMEAKEPGLPALEAIQDVMQKRFATLETLTETALRASVEPVEGMQITSMDLLEAAIDVAKQKKAGSEALHNRLLEEASRLTDISQTLTNAHASSIEEVKARLAKLQLAFSTTTQHSDLERVSHARERLTATDAVESLVAEIILGMPNYASKDGAMRTRRDLKDRIDQTDVYITSRRASQQGLRHSLDHIRNAAAAGDLAHCPKCGYDWVLGSEDNEEEKLVAAIAQLEEEIESGEVGLTKLREDLEDVTVYLDGLRRLGEVMRSAPLLQPLWSQLSPHFVSGESNPRACLPMMKIWRKSLDHSMELDELEAEMAEMQQAISHADAENSGSVSEITEKLVGLEAELEAAVSDIEQYAGLIDRLTKFRQGVQTVEQAYADIEASGRKAVDDIEMLLKVLLNRFISDEIRDRQALLAQAKEAYHRANNAQSIIDDIKRSRDEAAADAKALSIMVAELSPSDGLIAEHLVGFLNNFADTFNNILEQVWTYDFKLLPCTLEGAELNYNLPFTVGGTDRVVPDVTNGSKSMREFIDFAFKFVVMVYADLHDSPLFIDELVPSLDEQHRVNAMMFIKAFVEARRCSQMFMISHYAATHGAFANSEICVMDTANIVNMPGTYNRHVAFT